MNTSYTQTKYMKNPIGYNVKFFKNIISFGILFSNTLLGFLSRCDHLNFDPNVSVRVCYICPYALPACAVSILMVLHTAANNQHNTNGNSLHCYHIPDF